MTLRVRKWRKRKRELDQLLQFSESSDDQGSVKDSVSLTSAPSSVSGSVPGTSSLVSDPGTPDQFDFETDVDCWSSDSDTEEGVDSESTS